MNFRKVTKTFLKVAKQYQADMTEAVKYVEAQNLNAKMKDLNLNVDTRDFVPMVALMGIQGDNPAERAADIHRKIDELMAAFTNPDHNARKPYLDMIYDVVDTFDPATVDMDNTAQVGKLLQSYLIDQTIGMKQNENPEYYNSRYATTEAHALMDARNGFRMAVAARVATNLIENGIRIDIKLTLPYSVPHESRPAQACREVYEKGKRDRAVAAKGALPAETVIELPVLDGMMKAAGKDTEDFARYSNNTYDALYNYYNFIVENNLLQSGSKKTQGLKEAGLNADDAIYIDGRPLKLFTEAHFPNDPNIAKQQAKIVGTYLLNGSHQVDIVHSYRDEAGVMQYEAKQLKGVVTPEQEQLYMKQFNWFRRTFFNWGPFRIPPLQEKLERVESELDTAVRHASIIGQQKEKIENTIAQNAEKARKEKEEQERKNARRAELKNKEAQLEESVKQWEKDSVMDILGQDMKGVFTFIKGKLSIPHEQRYDAISERFAKVVLYTQFQMARSRDGAPCDVEKALMGDGNPETIKRNIDQAARGMAKDTFFKKFMLDKLGVQEGKIRCPNNKKFEDMILNGGFERYTDEYMQAVKENGIKMEQQADTLEKEMDMQKQTEAKTAAL